MSEKKHKGSFDRKALQKQHDSGAASTPAEKVELSPRAMKVAAQYKNESISPALFTGLMRIWEFAVVALCGIAVYLSYVGAESIHMLEYLFANILAAALYVIFAQFSSGYRPSVLRKPFRYLGRLIICWAGVFAVLAIVAFLLKISAVYSRIWFAGFVISGFIALTISRFLAAKLMRILARSGRMERRAVIVGGGQNAEDLILELNKQPDNDIRICGIFDDRGDRRSPPIVAGYPKLGNISELIEFARVARIDMLIVSLPISAEERVLTLMQKLWVLPVDIRLSAHAANMRLRPRAYSYIGSVPMLDILDKPINDWDAIAKRLFDIVFSLFGIVLFSPVMLATAIAIKLDSKGPVIFKQKRHGFNNEVINVWKFRSMYSDQCDPTAKLAVTKNDSRVTRVGRFIRKTSIDELPQFFNSLGGSLSLVGPRPHAISANSNNMLYNDVVDGYFARHKVKPGVTGWAQINGWRGEIDKPEKIVMRTEYDLNYIENWSLLFDLKILFLTPVRLMNTENAY